MKKTLAIGMAAALCLSAGGLAEKSPSPLESTADAFMQSLGQTWDAFLGMAGEAGNAVSAWADGASKELDSFLSRNAPELKQWLDETGQFFNKNVAPEISQAWDVLVKGASEAGAYTQTELKRAYSTLLEYMKDKDVDASVQQALKDLADAAGMN